MCNSASCNAEEFIANGCPTCDCEKATQTCMYLGGDRPKHAWATDTCLGRVLEGGASVSYVPFKVTAGAVAHSCSNYVFLVR